VLGRNRALVGVVTEPEANGNRPRIGIGLLNAWRVHRVGPHRLTVRLARRLAQKGFVVTRFDLSGIGDSPARSDGLPEGVGWVQECQDVIDETCSRYDLDGLVLMGICSGATGVFRTMCADPRAVGGVLINPLYYGVSEETDDALRNRGLAKFYLGRALWDPRRWKKFLTGRSSYGQLAEVLSSQLRGKLGSGSTSKAVDTITGEFDDLKNRNVPLLLVFSEGDRGRDVLRGILGDRVEELEGDGPARQIIIPRSDHTFTLRRSQEELFSVIEEWIAQYETSGTNGAS